MPDILVTHNDLDGYGCKFVARKIFPDIECMIASYGNCETVLHNALDEEPDMLIISDVWPGVGASDILLDRLNEQSNRLLIILDHHKGQAKKQQEMFSKAVVWNTPEICATKIMAEFFGLKLPGIDLVNEYDLSGTQEGQAGTLNAIFWEQKKSLLSKMLNRNPFYFTKREEKVFAKLETDRQEYFKKLLIEKFETNNHSVAFVDVDKYLSYVSKELLKSVESVIINNKGKSLSIRSNEPFALSIAEKLGGGGHLKAAGISQIFSREIIKQAVTEVFA